MKLCSAGELSALHIAMFCSKLPSDCMRKQSFAVVLQAMHSMHPLLCQSSSVAHKAQFQSSTSPTQMGRFYPHVAMYHLFSMFSYRNHLTILRRCVFCLQSIFLEEPALSAFSPNAQRSVGVLHELQALLCTMAIKTSGQLKHINNVDTYT